MYNELKFCRTNQLHLILSSGNYYFLQLKKKRQKERGGEAEAEKVLTKVTQAIYAYAEVGSVGLSSGKASIGWQLSRDGEEPLSCPLHY